MSDQETPVGEGLPIRKRKQGQRYNAEERMALQAEIFSLHAQRKNNQQIADKLGIDHNTVTLYIKKAYQEYQPDIREEFKKDVELLSKALEIAWTQYEKTHDHNDWGVVDKILNRRAKMLGLDSPEKLDITVHEVSQEDLAIMDLIQSEKAKNQLRLDEMANDDQ